MTTHADHAGDLHALLEERLEDAKRLWSSWPRESGERLFHGGAWIAHCEVPCAEGAVGQQVRGTHADVFGIPLEELALDGLEPERDFT